MVTVNFPKSTWVSVQTNAYTIKIYIGYGSQICGCTCLKIQCSDCILTNYLVLIVHPSDATPSMVELLCFSDRKRNIVVEIGAKYATFGIFLLEDKTGAIVEALEMEHHQNAERINMAILQQWLQGRGVKPVTWSTLVTVLQRIGMGSLAYEIASEIGTAYCTFLLSTQ